MSKYEILPHLNVKIGYLMTKYDVCQNMILSLNLNVKIGL